VYSTDAKVEPGVKIVGTFPADSHPPIIYPLAATSTAKPDATGYLAFLKSSAAQTIFEKYGFKFLITPTTDDQRVFDISPTEWTAILLSLRVATVATLIATPLGIGVAWLLARRDFWGKALVDALIYLPPVLPPVVTGYLLLLTFGKRGLVGGWLSDHLGIVFAFRWTGAALACGVMSFPLLVRPIRLSIEAVDRRLEQAASTLGAAPWRVFLTVTLPLALPGVLAGMVLGFAKAIGE